MDRKIITEKTLYLLDKYAADVVVEGKEVIIKIPFIETTTANSLCSEIIASMQ